MRLAKRDPRRATRELDGLRRDHPGSAYLPFLQGSLYFDRLWWKDGFDAYSAAIRRDPRYREHPPVILDALRSLSSNSQAWRGQQFLRDDIGPPAVPYLERFVTEVQDSKIRARAERVLAKLRHR